jgi:hypothetical protein
VALKPDVDEVKNSLGVTDAASALAM